MSKTTTAYADLGKAPNDLLGKGFPAASTIKVTHESSVPFGVLFKNNLSSKTDGSKVTLTVEPEYKTKLGDNAVSFKGKWTSADEVEGSATISDLVQPGSELKGWFASGQNDKTKKAEVKAGIEVGYSNDTFNFKLKTDSPSDLGSHKVDASLVTHAPHNVYWGVNVQFAHHGAKKGDPAASTNDELATSSLLFQGRLHCVSDDGKSSFTLGYETDPKSKDEKKVPQVAMTWYQKHDDASFATSFVVPPGKTPTASVAADKKHDANSSCKSKITLGGENRVAFAYTQTMNPYMVGTVGLDLNANKLVGGSGGGDHTFGFEVKLK